MATPVTERGQQNTSELKVKREGKQRKRVAGLLMNHFQGRKHFTGLISKLLTGRGNNAGLLLLVDVGQVNVCDVAPARAAGTSSGCHLLLRWLGVDFYLRLGAGPLRHPILTRKEQGRVSQPQHLSESVMGFIITLVWPSDVSLLFSNIVLVYPFLLI